MASHGAAGSSADSFKVESRSLSLSLRRPSLSASCRLCAGVGATSASLYLLVAGAWCIATDGAEKCCPAGYGGGVVMLVIGGIGPYLLLVVFMAVTILEYTEIVSEEVWRSSLFLGRVTYITEVAIP